VELEMIFAAASRLIAELVVRTESGERRGSGYRVSAECVLTAAHVIDHAMSIDIRFHSDGEASSHAGAAVAWVSAEHDIAVVTFDPPDEAKVPTATCACIPAHAVSQITAQAAGYPEWKQRTVGGRTFRDLHRPMGRLSLGANVRTGTLEFALADPGPPVMDRRSPWGGMSGAPVWAIGSGGDLLLVGLVSEHHPREGTGRLTVRPIAPALTVGTETARRELAQIIGIGWPVDLPAVSSGPAAPGGSLDVLGPVRAEPVWNVPSASRSFLGREGEVARWHEELSLSRTRYKPSVAVICGPPGVGKTQLAQRLASPGRERYSCGWWVAADNRLGCLLAFGEMAAELGLPASLPPEQAAERVTRRLTAMGRWLLIFDNADNWESIADLVPDTGDGHVIVTSRNSEWSEADLLIGLAQLDLDTAVRLLLAESGDDDAAAAAELATELGCLPLDLHAAAAFSAKRLLSLREYLGVMRDQRKRRGNAPHGPHSPETAHIVSLILEDLAIQDPLKAEVARVCSLLAPDRLPLGLVFDDLLAQRRSGLEKLRRGLLASQLSVALVQSGLVTRESGSRLRMHEVFQDVIRYGMNQVEREDTARAAIDILSRIFPSGGTPSDWARCARLLPHGQRLLERAESEALATPGAARLMRSMGTYLRSSELDRFGARDLIARALAVQEQLSPDRDDADIVKTMGMLADSLYWTGDFRGSAETAQVAVDMSRRLHPGDHIDTAEAMVAQAVALTYVGEHERGREIGAAALDMLNRLRPGGDLRVASALHSLGASLYWAGYHQTALEMDQLALDLRTQLIEGDDQGVTAVLADIGANHYWLGNYEEGVEAADRALAMDRRLFEGDHPHITWVLIVAANCRRMLGDPEQARQLHQEGLDMGRRYFEGRDRPSLAMGMFGLADVDRDLGDLVEGYSQAQAGLEMAEGLFAGHDHLVLIEGLLCVSVSALASGDADRASRMATEAAQMAQRLLPADHRLLRDTREAATAADRALGGPAHPTS